MLDIIDSSLQQTAICRQLQVGMSYQVDLKTRLILVDFSKDFEGSSDPRPSGFLKSDS